MLGEGRRRWSADHRRQHCPNIQSCRIEWHKIHSGRGSYRPCNELKDLSNQATRRYEGCARSKEKIPEPYAQFYILSQNRPFVAVRGRRYVLADWYPNHCRNLRKHLRIITYPCRMGQTLRIHLPQLTYAFTYQPYKLHNMNTCIKRYARYDPSSRTISWYASCINVMRTVRMSYAAHA